MRQHYEVTDSEREYLRRKAVKWAHQGRTYEAIAAWRDAKRDGPLSSVDLSDVKSRGNVSWPTKYWYL